ncbi:MAG TPA: DNA-binding protein [Cytophagales bacterium]|nr:DNA-binding protein [Cytophagales bacterium]
MNLEVICLESDAFNALITEVVQRIKDEIGQQEDPWVGPDEAMRLLSCGKTTLQKYRNEDTIDFRKLDAKTILYSRASIMAYIESKTDSLLNF